MNLLTSLGLTQTQGTLFLLFSILWILPWKAIGLWKASQNGHKWWFVFIFIINTFALLEIYYIFFGAERQIEKDLLKEEVEESDQNRHSQEDDSQ